jgi:hypothetical protein
MFDDWLQSPKKRWSAPFESMSVRDWGCEVRRTVHMAYFRKELGSLRCFFCVISVPNLKVIITVEIHLSCF